MVVCGKRGQSARSSRRVVVLGNRPVLRAMSARASPRRLGELHLSRPCRTVVGQCPRRCFIIQRTRLPSNRSARRIGRRGNERPHVPYVDVSVHVGPRVDLHDLPATGDSWSRRVSGLRGAPSTKHSSCPDPRASLGLGSPFAATPLPLPSPACRALRGDGGARLPDRGHSIASRSRAPP